MTMQTNTSKSNDVNHVLVSQGTRAMARGGADVAEKAEQQILSIKTKRTVLVERKHRLVARLGEIKNEIVLSQPHGGLPPERYKKLCDEQLQVGKDLRGIDTELSRVSVELRKAQTSLDEAKGYVKPGDAPTNRDVIDRIEKKVDLILEMLRNAPATGPSDANASQGVSNDA